MIIRIVGLLIIAMFASACASLNVTVDIYDGPLIDDSTGSLQDLVAKEAFFDSAIRNRRFEEFITDVLNRHEAINFAFYRSNTRYAGSEAKYAAEDRQDLEQYIRSEWKRVNDAATVVSSFSRDIAQARALNRPTQDVNNLSYSLTIAVNNYLDAADTFKTVVIDLVRKAVKATPGMQVPIDVFKARAAGEAVALVHVNAKIAAKISRIAASDTVEGRSVGFPIFDPDMRRLEKKSKFWKPFVTNKFDVMGGNAQFVVVRDGLVVYRQKSLDFDPTPVVGAGTALAKLGLKVAAARAVGSYSSTQSTPGQAQVNDTDLVDLARLDSLEYAVNVRNNATVQALNSLAELHAEIVANNAISDDGLKSYRERLQSLLAFYQGKLKAAEVADND